MPLNNEGGEKKMCRAKYGSYVPSPKISGDFCTGTGNRNRRRQNNNNDRWFRAISHAILIELNLSRWQYYILTIFIFASATANRPE